MFKVVTNYLGEFLKIYVFQALMAKVAQTATLQTKTTECLRMPSMQLKVIHFQNKVYVSDDKMFFQQEVQALTAKRLVSTTVQTTATVRDSLFGFRELTCIPVLCFIVTNYLGTFVIVHFNHSKD